MQPTKAELIKQIEGVREAGLYEFIVASAQHFKLPFAYFLAVASRETNMVNELGDHGFAHGIFQIDSRSFPEICQHDFNKDPALFIDTAAKLLLTNLGWAKLHWPKYSLEQRQKIAAAAYNCGKGNVLKAVPQGDCDLYTAHANYGKSVVAIAKLIQEILDDESKTKTADR